MTYEICFSIITAAWAILVIYLVLTLIDLRKFLRASEKSVGNIGDMLAPISTETTKILQASSFVTDNIARKTQEMGSLFDSLSNVKHSVSSFFSPSIKVEQNSLYTPQNWIELTALGILLWQKYKNNKEFVYGKEKSRKFTAFK